MPEETKNVIRNFIKRFDKIYSLQIDEREPIIELILKMSDSGPTQMPLI
jgi:hypothetical protein